MAKVKSKWICQNCGYETPKYMGKCPECSQWATFVEEVVSQTPVKTNVSIEEEPTYYTVTFNLKGASPIEPVEVLGEAENTNVEYPEEDDVDFVQLAQDEFVDDEYAPEIQEDDDSVFDDIVSGELQTTDYENIEADILLKDTEIKAKQHPK